jgi:hypothetical protein
VQCKGDARPARAADRPVYSLEAAGACRADVAGARTAAQAFTPAPKRRTRGAVSAEVVGRLVGLVVLAVLTVLVLANGIAMPSGAILNFLHLINLVFHEAGHVIFGFFGQFIAILGGSANQVLIPALCTGVFLYRGQYGSAAATLFWTGQSLADISVYVYDGRAMALPLLAEGLIHDWNFILGRLGLLFRAEALGRLTFGLGGLTMVAAVALLAWDAWTHLLRVDRRPDARVE